MLVSYYALVLTVLALWFVLLRLWERRVDADITAGAAVQWDLLKRRDPDLLEGFDRARFEALFRRVEAPRGPRHVFAAVAIFLAAAPLVLAGSTLALRALERAGIIPQPAEQAQRLRVTSEGIRIIREADLTTLQYILQGWAGFSTFFSLLIFWVIVFYLVMRRLHARKPGSLREEILRAR